MSDQNMAVVRRLLEGVWGAGDLELAEELIEPIAYRSHLPDVPAGRMTHWTGPNIVRVEVAAYRSGFPDLQVQVRDLVADADAVAAFWSVRGTNTGTMRLTPVGDVVDEELGPSQKELSAGGCSLFGLTGGKVAVAEIHWDPLGLLDQVRLFAKGVQVLDLNGNRVSLVVPPD